MSKQAKANRRLTGLTKQFWLEGGGVHGYRKIHSDLREHGELCSKNRVHRLMQLKGLSSGRVSQATSAPWVGARGGV